MRIEYKYSPNLLLIDTPGLIQPPKGKQLSTQQRALAQASREVEQLVLSKMRTKEYIVLCVEDTNDWRHATTRNLVMQVDPQLARTVLVSTKLDTKLPNGQNYGFVINTQRIVANKVFVQKNPAAAKLFEVMQLPVGAINAQNLRMRDGQNKPQDIERHTDGWINANQKTFDGWIAQALAAASK